jgi:hypothetical protein
MTAGMNTGNLDGGRISLPRAGLGALLAGTLLAGSLLGAATYATVSMINANAATHAAAISAARPQESTVVRDARIAAGNGPLAGDVRGVPTGTTRVSNVTQTTAFPAARDGFGYDQAVAPAPKITIQHAAGRGPLQ